MRLYFSKDCFLLLQFLCYRKLAEQYLDEAFHKIGTIDELELVYKEAAKSATRATQSHSTLSMFTEQPSTAAKTKPQTATSVAEGAAAAQRAPNSASANQPQKNAFSHFKTALCKHWKETKSCPHGEYCLFAHGKGELRSIAVCTYLS